MPKKLPKNYTKKRQTAHGHTLNTIQFLQIENNDLSLWE